MTREEFIAKVGPNGLGANIAVNRLAEGDFSLWVATVDELPDVREYANSAGEARALARDTVVTTVQMFQNQPRIA